MVYEGFYQVCCTFLSLLEWGAQPELRAAEQIPFWGWQTAAAKNPAVGFYFWIKQSENLAIPFCNEVWIVSNCSFLVVPPHGDARLAFPAPLRWIPWELCTWIQISISLGDAHIASDFGCPPSSPWFSPTSPRFL